VTSADLPQRLTATAAATQAIERLQAARGPVVIFQSGGCCNGSIPLCFLKDQLPTAPSDVLLGVVAGCPVYIDARQFEVVRGTQLSLDVAPGDPEGFSLPAGDHEHFVVGSRLFTEGEKDALSLADAEGGRPRPE
jgi:uncharacterized protein (DUF779 family)